MNLSRPSIFLCICFLLLLNTEGSTQGDNSIIQGVITNAQTGTAIEFVTIYIEGTSRATESDVNGEYAISIPADSEELVFSRIGYKEHRENLNDIKDNELIQLDIGMVPQESNLEVTVKESRLEESEMVRENIEELKLIPTTTGNLESILPSIALGTSGGTGGELSSQYNVRGGNYDENLVYVNDFEIFRPQLIRNSQQEGLSFPNIDLISNISFSSGGFQSKYGDKMSSILDIQYKRPEEFKASVGFSLLGASAHIEGSKAVGGRNYNKLRYLVGARYKTSRYLLGSLDVKGQYTPDFTDIQSYITYDLSRDWQLAVIANYNVSNFNFIPKERATAFGSFFTTLRLTSLFEGAEKDDFTNGMGGVSLTYIPDRQKNPFFLKLLASSYASFENETFDIQGFYSLAQVETGLGENSGQDVALIGAGTQHNFARNALKNRVTNVAHRGGIELQMPTSGRTEKTNFLQWGIKAQLEDFTDELNEWERLDSAGYSLPYDEDIVNVYNVTKTNNDIISTRVTAYLQNSYTIIDPGRREIKATLGVRTSFWDLNKEFLVSPRVQFLYKPLDGRKDFSLKLAGGVYYQPPFYRELRRLNGSLNKDIKSQRSIHALAGFTYDFGGESNGKKKYRFIAEAYYKKLDNLISYEIDNVRIRYSGENDASGYINGIDFRINGEFVPGVESWVNLSFLQAREKITGVEHMKFNAGDSVATVVNYVPRPTDQLFYMNVFFQDYLPGNENFKMHLNLIYGSGLPFGIKDNNIVIRNSFKYRPYQRVDLGFSWAIWNGDSGKISSLFGWSKNVWMSLEVFNMLGIENVASNTWIKSIFNQQYAIPNNLTSRRINLRFKIDL